MYIVVVVVISVPVLRIHVMTRLSVVFITTTVSGQTALATEIEIWKAQVQLTARCL